MSVLRELSDHAIAASLGRISTLTSESDRRTLERGAWMLWRWLEREADRQVPAMLRWVWRGWIRPVLEALVLRYAGPEPKDGPPPNVRTFPIPAPGAYERRLDEPPPDPPKAA